MSTWKTILSRLASNADDKFDELALRLSQRLGSDKGVQIIPYLGYGTAETIYLKGRVLRDRGVTKPTDQDSVWENLLNTYRFINSSELPGAVVQATCAGAKADFTADKEGYFDIKLEVGQRPPPGTSWHEVSLELIHAPVPFEPPVTAVGRALVPPPGAAFGIITDIDDTVLQSSATNYLKAARLMFLQNARTRLAFPGVAAFYQALQQGDGEQADRNPIFYVSSSPWNLYTLLADFFEFQSVPTGPLFLMDYGLEIDQLITTGHSQHKMAQIYKIMTAYPELPFVLMGDSGQKDPEIYRDVVETYSGRVKAIYIRDVTAEERDAAVQAIAADVSAKGVPMVLTADSLAAAEHAAQHGLITADRLPAIRQTMEGDKAAADHDTEAALAN